MYKNQTEQLVNYSDIKSVSILFGDTYIIYSYVGSVCLLNEPSLITIFLKKKKLIVGLLYFK